jgi:regulatory protein
MVGENIKITKVDPFAGGFRVWVSTQEEPLELTSRLYHEHRLKAGIVITEPQLRELAAESEKQRCENEVSRLLAMRDHTVGEVWGKLKRKKFGEATIQDAIKRFTDQGFLDDRRAAARLVRQTLERNPAGRAYLIGVLRRKRIARELAEEVVDEVLSESGEQDRARAALERKWPQLAQLDVETARKKAYSYLSRRGFGYAAARAAFDELSDASEVTED